MKTKKCTKCKKILTLDSFGYREQRVNDKIYKSRKSHCKKCISIVSKTCRNDNKKRANDYERNYYQTNKRKLVKIMGGKCVCCGISEWWVLTFDHIKPSKSKKRIIISIFKLLNDKKLRKKFQIMCSGCNSSKNKYEKCKIKH